MNRAFRQNRRGAISVLYVILLIPILGLVALAVDYGYLLTVRVELQRAADQATLAAVQDLIPEPDGFQDVAAARARVREYVELNLDGTFTVRDEDIEIGRYEPSTVYSNLTILNDGIYDTVRVTLRRDELANTSVALFFASLIGIDNSDITATSTAVLQKARFLYEGTHILPMAIPMDVWDSFTEGDQWSIYGNGQLEDEHGNQLPGNWGTVDIGTSDNSTSDLGDQIVEGLRQSELDALYAEGRINQTEYIDSQVDMSVNGDTGLSSGLKHSVRAVHGTRRLVPIFTSVQGTGNNMEMNIAGWGVVTVIDSVWAGDINTRIIVQKSYTYDSQLRAHPDLSNTGDVIQSAYTSPVLVE